MRRAARVDLRIEARLAFLALGDTEAAARPGRDGEQRSKKIGDDGRRLALKQYGQQLRMLMECLMMQSQLERRPSIWQLRSIIRHGSALLSTG